MFSFRENLSKNKWKWWIMAIVVNLFLVVILFFFTTPLIIINSLNELEYLKPLQEHVSISIPVPLRYLVPIQIHLIVIFELTCIYMYDSLSKSSPHVNILYEQILKRTTTP